MILILLINIIPNISFNSHADSNLPQDKGNGWWNTTAGIDWVVNTTGNIWKNKNILIQKSLVLVSGGVITFVNCTVIIEENVDVGYNSTLNIINSTFKFNSSENGSSEFSVDPGGSLYISDYDLNPITKSDRSNITSNITDPNHQYIFSVSFDSNFTMKNSELHCCGYSESPYFYGLYVNANNCTIENNTITSNYAGLIIESSNNSVKNNRIINNDYIGLLLILGGNNTLEKNMIENNNFNFGLLINEIEQSSNISSDNKINNKSILYLESMSDQNYNSSLNQYSFIGLVSCNNTTVSGQKLNENFNSVLIFNTKNCMISNTNISDNLNGIYANNIDNFTLLNCSISNSDLSGIEFIDLCKQFFIINCTMKNNYVGIRATNSNITIINSTISDSFDKEIYLMGDTKVQAINCTLNGSNLRTASTKAKLVAKNYLNIRTINHTSYPIGNVSLKIQDGENKTIFEGDSDQRGILNWILCTSFIFENNKLNSKMSRYTITANYAGMEFRVSEIVNKFKTVDIKLNHAPEITNPTTKTVFVPEDSKFYYDFDFYDKDLDHISWNCTTNANWLEPIDDNTGEITGKPQNQDVGRYFLNVTCHDNYSGLAFYNFSLVVNNTNDAPEILATSACCYAYEDMLYIYDFNVSDVDLGDTHEWSMTTDASWLFPIHNTLGRIFGYPYQKHVGSYYVNVSCKDVEDAMDFYNFTLVVYPTNDPPAIINISTHVMVINEDSLFYHKFEYYDMDDDAVNWSCKTNATWLEMINCSTGELCGTPLNRDVGKYFVNVSCRDMANADTFFNFTLIVVNTNDPPTFTPGFPAELFAVEDEYFEYTFKIIDQDVKDDFEFAMSTEYNVSTNLNLDSTNRNSNANTINQQKSWLSIAPDSKLRQCKIFGIPTNLDVGILKVILNVTDSGESTDSIEFIININNSNDPPKITNLERSFVYVLEDKEYYHDFDYFDVDGDEVSWKFNTNADWFSTQNPATGELSGTPKQTNVGMVYYVDVLCMDPYGGSDSQNYSIKINNTNDPPMILNPCETVVWILENQDYQYDFNSIDLDSSNVYWSSRTNAAWLNEIETVTGIISGTPGDFDLGTFFVNITCRDDEYYSVHWNYSIVVSNTPDAPRITNAYLAPISINIDEEYYFKFKAIDVDGDPYTWYIDTNASGWLDFDDTNATLFGVPKRFDIGRYYINITCRDINNCEESFYFYIMVIGLYNRAPELSQGQVEPKSGYNDTRFTFFVIYRDLDNDKPYTVIVNIDKVPYHMEKFSDTNITEGVIYKFSIKLSLGNHTYYFQALDGLYKTAVVYDFTPTYQSPGVIKVTEKSQKVKTAEGLDLLWVFVILLILVELSLGLYFLNRRRKRKRRLAIAEEPIELISVPPMEFDTEETTARSDIGSSTEKAKETTRKARSEIHKGRKKKDVEIVKESEQKKLREQDGHEQPEESEMHKLMICPECGEFVNETFTSCPGCGVKFIFKKDLTELKGDGDVDLDLDKMDHDILICPECGEFVNEINKSCPGCGVPFKFETDD